MSTAPGQMIIIGTDGSMVQTDCPRPPALEEVQAAVGGYVELVADIVHADKRVQVYCNEDGKGDGLPTNTRATILMLHMVPGFGDYFVGPVVMLVGSACWRE